MNWLRRPEANLHWRVDGSSGAKPVLFLNSLGSDLRLWDPVLEKAGPSLRAIRMDTRGHGLSDAPKGPYDIDELISDAEAVAEAFDASGLAVVGISLGGQMALGLAHRRPDLVSALVISNSAPKLGDAQLWHERIRAVEANGLPRIADAVLSRWFADPGATCATGPWRSMLERTPAQGYIGCCGALAAADLTDRVAQVQQPTLVIGGTQDRSSPPEATRALAAELPNGQYHEFENVGHLPPIEVPDFFWDICSRFLSEAAR